MAHHVGGFPFESLNGMFKPRDTHVRCPYCRKKDTIRVDKIGHYRLECGECNRRFVFFQGHMAAQSVMIENVARDNDNFTQDDHFLFDEDLEHNLAKGKPLGKPVEDKPRKNVLTELARELDMEWPIKEKFVPMLPPLPPVELEPVRRVPEPVPVPVPRKPRVQLRMPRLDLKKKFKSWMLRRLKIAESVEDYEKSIKMLDGWYREWKQNERKGKKYPKRSPNH